jgi:hypothetical protein
MVEQWPFKPLVKGSSPFALTLFLIQIGFGSGKNNIFDCLIVFHTRHQKSNHWLYISLKYAAHF